MPSSCWLLFLLLSLVPAAQSQTQPANYGPSFWSSIQVGYDSNFAGPPTGKSLDGQGSYDIMRYQHLDLKIYSITPDSNPNSVFMDVSIHVKWYDPDVNHALSKLPLVNPAGKNQYSLVVSTQDPPTMNVWTPAFLFGSVSAVRPTDTSFANRAGYLRVKSNVSRSAPPNKLYNMDIKKRVVIKVNCKNKFQAFPFDKHECAFDIEFGSGLEIASANFLASGTWLPTSFGTYTVTDYCVKCGLAADPWEGDKPPSHSRAAVRVYYTRESSKYIIKHILPLLLVSIVSLSSLFVDVAVAPARAALSVTSMLSLITLMFVLTRELPSVPYLSITGSLIFICLIFAVINMVVFVLCHYLATQIKNGKPVNPEGSGGDASELSEQMLDKPVETTHVQCRIFVVDVTLPKDAVAKIQKVMTPTVVIGFFLIFFLYLTIAIPVNRGKGEGANTGFWEGCPNINLAKEMAKKTKQWSWPNQCATSG
eukprot:TRINITY_DN63107_c0_g1_i1.p1 TRINITY_DN63107_c0_g1~~TRINITY_DN63107_c0_g1_i1.p1  ORF type:complete len:479 (+),score=44.23 TRINITY_DN63107_c0_g1_i1:32-1468(+)